MSAPIEWAVIDDLLTPEGKQEGEFTAKEYAAHIGKTEATARERLRKAVMAGKFLFREVGMQKYYRLANPPKCE